MRSHLKNTMISETSLVNFSRKFHSLIFSCIVSSSSVIDVNGTPCTRREYIRIPRVWEGIHHYPVSLSSSLGTCNSCAEWRESRFSIGSTTLSRREGTLGRFLLLQASPSTGGFIGITERMESRECKDSIRKRLGIFGSVISLSSCTWVAS